MDEKPENAAPKPRRRLQFSLRTLLIFVTLIATLAAILGWQLNFIRERQAALMWLKQGAGWSITTAEYEQLPDQPPHDPASPSRQIPKWRRWLGDEPIASIGFERKISTADRERVRRLFPEAEISEQ
jgi:hypothetical protein